MRPEEVVSWLLEILDSDSEFNEDLDISSDELKHRIAATQNSREIIEAASLAGS